MSNKEKLVVVKVGGNVIDDEKILETFLQLFSTISLRKILVHGGGKIATTIGKKMGITSQYINGRRITDDDTIDLVTMVYGGWINKKIVALLQHYGCDAIGITGADGNLIPATKRAVTDIDFGWVGDVDWKNIPADKWKVFIDNGLIPVVAPLTHDGKSHLLNTNADTIAANVAAALSHYYDTQLIFCFEKNGILTNVLDENSTVPFLNFDNYVRMKESGQLVQGILPKLENAFFALQNGVDEVVVGHSNHLAELISGTNGTKIILGN